MATTYVLLNEYIPEIKFKGKLLNSDVVTVGETATFDASDSNFCSDYAGIIHGFYKKRTEISVRFFLPFLRK